MKRKNIIFLVSIMLLTILTGCSKSGSDSKLKMNNDKILDSYETKTLEKDITYKEITYTIGNNLELAIIIYNNSDRDISVDGAVLGFKGTERTSQVSQKSKETIAAHSANYISFLLLSADNYKVSRLDVEYEDDVISKDDFEYETYVIEDEKQLYNSKYENIPTLKLFGKYKNLKNSEKEAKLEVSFIGFKDNKPVCFSRDFVNYIDTNNKQDYNKKITKAGDRGSAEIYCKDAYKSGITMNDMEKIIYFVNGYYN